MNELEKVSVEELNAAIGELSHGSRMELEMVLWRNRARALSESVVEASATDPS